MSSRMSTVESVRIVLVLALVFLLSFVGAGILGAPVITALVYFVWQYRRRIRKLESRLAEATGQQSTASGMQPKSENQLPPSSTDA